MSLSPSIHSFWPIFVAHSVGMDVSRKEIERLFIVKPRVQRGRYSLIARLEQRLPLLTLNIYFSVKQLAFLSPIMSLSHYSSSLFTTGMFLSLFFGLYTR